MHEHYNRYSYVLNNPLKYTDPSGWMYKVEKTNKADDPPINFDNFYSNYGGGSGGGYSDMGFDYNYAGPYSMYASNPGMYAFMYGTQTWMQTATATAAVRSALSSAYTMLSKSGTGTQHIRGQNNVGNAGEQKIRSLSYTWTFGDKSSNAYISNYNNYTNAIAQVGGASGGGGSISIGGGSISIGGENFSLAGMYMYFQIGGNSPMTINMSSVDFGGATQKVLGLTGMKPGDKRGVNLFNISPTNSAALAFGNVNMMYHGNNQFSIVGDNSSKFDFWPLVGGSSLKRDAGNVLGATINYNIIPSIMLRSPIPTLIPLIFGGPYDVNFRGTIYIPK